jgi:EAL domain-containing protein (putative c-di-GMP-specific phosphodiesterase class I)
MLNVESTKHGCFNGYPIQQRDDHYVAEFLDYCIESAFQPIYTFAHNRPVAYEALLRAHDRQGNFISPPEVLRQAAELGQSEKLEITLIILHAVNFFRFNIQQEWLFLNLNPVLTSNNLGFIHELPAILNQFDIPLSRIVIEIVENSVSAHDNLIRAVKYLKQCGFIIAIDDFGAGHSNFSRIWDLRPNIVKLDRELLSRFRRNSGLKPVLASLVEMLHESEALVLVEGIEDEQDAVLAAVIDTDMHQGYFFGKPQSLLCHDENPYLAGNLFDSKNHTIPASQQPLPEMLKALFLNAVNIAQVRPSLADSCHSILNHPKVIRCYLLNENGLQIDEEYGQYAYDKSSYNTRSLPQVSEANWSRRIYFRKAIANMCEFHQTRPYLSLTSMNKCVTYSMGFNNREKTSLVLCCDIEVD